MVDACRDLGMKLVAEASRRAVVRAWSRSDSAASPDLAIASEHSRERQDRLEPSRRPAPPLEAHAARASSSTTIVRRSTPAIGAGVELRRA